LHGVWQQHMLTCSQCLSARVALPLRHMQLLGIVSVLQRGWVHAPKAAGTCMHLLRPNHISCDFVNWLLLSSRLPWQHHMLHRTSYTPASAATLCHSPKPTTMLELTSRACLSVRRGYAAWKHPYRREYESQVPPAAPRHQRNSMRWCAGPTPLPTQVCNLSWYRLPSSVNAFILLSGRGRQAG
jgi:hypothetical protein